MRSTTAVAKVCDPVIYGPYGHPGASKNSLRYTESAHLFCMGWDDREKEAHSVVAEVGKMRLWTDNVRYDRIVDGCPLVFFY